MSITFYQLKQHKMKRIISIVLSGILLLSTLSGCTNPSTQTKTQWPKTYKVWVIAPLSWPAANYGEDAVNTYKFITDKFNAENSGKIHIDLIFEDWKCDGKNATSAMQKLINIDQVKIVMWEVCSSAAIPADKIAQANKVIAISPVSSATEISNIWSYVYRFFNDANSTKTISNYLDSQGIKNIAILAENTDYSLWYKNGIKNNFKWKIWFEEIFNSDEKDFDLIAKKLKNASNINALIVIWNSDTTNIPIFKALNKNWLLEKFKWKIYGTEITATDSTIAAIWSLLEWVKVTDLMWLDQMGTKAKQLLEDFKNNYQIKWVDFFVNLMGEAMSLSLDAIKQNWYTADGIKAYFDSYSASNLRDWYFGKYYFGPQRDAIGLNFVIYEVINGKKIIIE